MKHPAFAALDAWMALKLKSYKRQKEGSVTLHFEVLNYSLKPYASDEIIAEKDADMMRLPQLSNKSSMEYMEALWNKPLRSNRL